TDIFRDRRTVIAAVVVPVVLYPLLILFSVQTVTIQAQEVAGEISAAVEGSQSITGAATGEASELAAAMDGAELVIATGGPGVCLLGEETRKACSSLQVAIDLNAVPPEGVEGVGGAVSGEELDGVICYGALGVGGIKMKIHRSCVSSLFDSNDRVLDADEMLAVGRSF
ncbi:MAG: hypothetical protein MK479_10095, partial [Planctomycetes bacterium]|nr:hypothetical protein [Planctomycetota bacterium]